MTGNQCRVARAYLGWTLVDLTRRTRGKVSRNTILTFEKGDRRAQAGTAEAIEAVLVAHGIVFDKDGVNVNFEPPAKKTRKSK